MEDNKYVVFKKKDWDLFVQLDDWADRRIARFREQSCLSDAVVIRRQDWFAPSVLAAYADHALSAADLIEEAVVSTPDTRRAVQNLRDLADYFRGQADLALQENRKLPD